MHERRHYAVSTVAGLVAGLVTVSVSATAHTAGTWYEGKWRTGTINGVVEDQVVDWRFVDNVPKNGQRAAIKRGASDWNGEGGTAHPAAMRFHYQSAQPDYNKLETTGFCTQSTVDDQSQYQRNKVGWKSFGGDSNTTNESTGRPEPLADAPTCLLTDSNGNKHLFVFKVRVNKDYPYYRGTDSVPSDKYDLWAVAAHEFGHATGFLDKNDGHWPESWGVCPGIDDAQTMYRHTMCPTLIRGHKAQRNLAEHDLHTFLNWY